MIAYARVSRRTRSAIGNEQYQFARDWLNDQQRSAVRNVICSNDGVVAVTGGAGTGKMAKRFEVYRETAVDLSVGDKVRITLGGTSIDNRQITVTMDQSLEILHLRSP